MTDTSLNKGKLYLFTSYTPGAGKTYLMLSKALEEVEKGKRVSLGFINSNHRDISNLLLEHGVKTKINRNYHIKRILKNNPQLVVFDELGMSKVNKDNPERFVYEDVKELLEKGIDIYASANLKRFSSLNPLYKQISGIGIRKTIPDYYLEMAEEIFLIDRRPELMQEDFNSRKLFSDKFNNSNIMRKNFTLEVLEQYRTLTYKILEKYKDKLTVVQRNN